MANALYAYGREGFLSGDIDFATATIKAALVTNYAPDMVLDQFVDDITGAAGGEFLKVVTLDNKTVTGGVADAGDCVFTAIPSAEEVLGVVVFQASAVTGGADVAATEQRLIAYYDTSTGVALPLTGNGGDVTVQWDNGPNKMFSL